MASDRIFGTIVIITALAYIAGANQTQTSFLSDPVGPKTFPVIVGVIAIICGMFVIARPDKNPEWPNISTIAKLATAVVTLIIYAYALKPLGFIIPTAVAAGVISYQINPKATNAIVTGPAIAVVLFFIFKHLLGLGLVALPKFFAE